MKFVFGVLTYNQEKYILETLESIKYQVVKYGQDNEVRLIITDDNSKDHTETVITYWIEQNKELFSEITYIRNDSNQGTVKNYNTILSKIDETECFKIIAGDDLISSNNLFEEYKGLTTDKIITYNRLYFKNGKTYYEEKDIIEFLYNMYHKKTQLYNLKCMRRGNFFHTPSTLYSKKLYENAKCQKLNRQFKLFEDDPTWYSMIKNVENLKIEFKKSVIILYRMHELSVSNSETVNIDFMRDYKKLKRIYLKDAKGFEKLYLWMKIRKLPKLLDLSKYLDKIYYQYKKIKVKKVYDWNGMKKWIEKNKKEQQLYYNYILEQVKKYKRILKEEKNILI